MAGRVYVTARAFWDHGEAAEALLRQHGFEVVRSPKPGPYRAEALIPLLQGYDAVIASSDDYSLELFTGCPNLKVVSRWGVGIDSVDLKAATQAGVLIVNTPGAMTDTVADFTFALMLSLSRRIVEGDVLMRSGGWSELPGVLVWGKTLGLIGFGQIGQGVARRAAGFNMRVLAYDPPQEAQKRKSEGEKGKADRSSSPLEARRVKAGSPDELDFVEFTTLDDLLAQSDFVSLHAAATPETRGLFNAARFAQMKPTAYLINTARGVMIDETALLEALETGRIAGAALDVYQQEPPPPDHPLRRAPRCLLTPHNAFNAVEAARATSLRTVENIMALWRGDRSAPVCNPDVWDAPTRRI